MTKLATKSVDFLAKQQDLFLRHYIVSGYITTACKYAGCCFTTYQAWCQSDPDFVTRFEAAKVEREHRLIDMYEEEADRRAIEGADEPIYWRGEKVGSKKRYSDILLIFRLKGMAPEKYADRGYLDTRNANLNIQEVNVQDMTPEEAERYVRQLLANIERVKPELPNEEENPGPGTPASETNASQGNVARISNDEQGNKGESGQK